MNSIVKELATETALSLLRLTPAGAFIVERGTGTLREMIRAAGVSSKDADLIRDLASEVAKGVEARVSQEQGNQGSAASAAIGVLDTIRKARITPQLLVSLNLDAGRLCSHLREKFPPRDLGMASAARRQLYGQGVDEFSERLIGHALALPGVQLAIQQEILKRQSELLERLERLVSVLPERAQRKRPHA